MDSPLIAADAGKGDGSYEKNGLARAGSGSYFNPAHLKSSQWHFGCSLDRRPQAATISRTVITQEDLPH